MLYLLLAGVFCYFYYKKVIFPYTGESVSSLNAVASFDTYKPFQFRLLLPMMFMVLKSLGIVAGKKFILAYSFLIVYAVIVVQFRLISEYLENTKAALLLAPVILYPMAWNYILINNIFMYYDLSAILLFSLGLYFILKDNFRMLLLVFLTGLLNKETIAYLAIAYALFNYRILFTKKIIINIAIFAVVFIVFKFILNYIFAGNPGDTVEITFLTNMWILEDLFTNHIYTKDVFLNFGAMYVIAILLFVTGRWKRFPDRRKVYMNLTFFIYLLMGVTIVYFTEVRVFSELMPLVSLLFIIYISTFEKLNLKPRS